MQSRVSWSTKEVDEALVEGINGFWSSSYDVNVEPFDVFDAILLTHPDNAVALTYRATLYMNWDYDIEAAEADYARALELGAPAGLIEGLQAYTLYGEDEIEATRAKAEASAQAGNAIGSFVLAWMTEYGDATQEEAITHYTQALKDDDGLSPAFTVRLYTGRAEVLRLLSRFDEALADVEKALALDPGNYAALATRDNVGWSTKDVDVALAEGINLFWSDNSYQSIAVFDAILFTHPDNGVALAYQASFSYSEDVEAEYQKALALEPDPGLVEGLQALDAYEADDMETAETKARQAIALGNPIGFYILGQIAYYADEEEDAYDFFTQAIEDDDHASPSFTAQLYIYRGKSLYYLGRYEDAIVEVNTGMALVPEDYETVAFRGNIYRMLHQYPRALKDYNSALTDHPDYMYALRGRADTYFYLGQYDEALLDAKRVLADDPDNVFSLNTRGGVYKELGQYDDALIDYTHALEIEPEDTYTLANRALLYLAMKDYSQALIDVNDALNVTPDNLYLLSVRGATYRLLEDYNKALSDYNRVLEMAPNDDYALEGRGHVYHDMGAYDNALLDFTRILERNPEHTAVLVRRARTYLALGRKIEAIADVNVALALEPENKDANQLSRSVLR